MMKPPMLSYEKMVHPVPRTGLANGHTANARFYWPAFALGLGAFVFLDTGGRISFLEIVLFTYLLGRVAIGRRQRPYFYWYLFAFAAIVLGMAVATTVYGRDWIDLIQPVANYGMLGVAAVALSMFLSVSFRSRFSALVVGSGFSQFLGLLFSPTAEILIDPWKFGLGYACSVLILGGVFLASNSRPHLVVTIPIMITLSILHLFMGTRSLAGVMLLGACLLLMRAIIGKPRKLNIGLFLAVTVFIIASTFGAYSELASSGALGADAALKWTNQSGDFGIIPGARKELLLLLAAWIASPLYGWGPLAIVDRQVISGLYRWYVENGYLISSSDYKRLFQEFSLPLHSVVLGMVVQAGLFAIPFVGILVKDLAHSLRSALYSADGLIMFIVLTGILHFVASPLGDITRFSIAIAAAIGVLSATNHAGRMYSNASTRPHIR